MKVITMLLFFTVFLSGCGMITIVTGKWETSEDFRVDTNTKPSELINNFIKFEDSLRNGNYFISFYDIYCGFSYRQIIFCNNLYVETKQSFNWIAITLYDSVAEEKYRKTKKISDYYRYQYPNYHEVNGLKSSLRNLYYNNDIPHPDIVPMNMIIVNDSIVKIIRGAIDTKEKYEFYKNYMDSIIYK